MIAALLTAAALAEIRGEMSMSTFMQYHWVLSGGLLVWQLGDSATDMGKMMFALPHLFTLWSTAAVMGGSGAKQNTD